MRCEIINGLLFVQLDDMLPKKVVSGLDPKGKESNRQNQKANSDIRKQLTPVLSNEEGYTLLHDMRKRLLRRYPIYA